MLETWRIKKGDKVIVTTGEDKGKKGEVLSVLRKKDQVLVKGINIVTRHQKPTQASAGGIVKKEAPLHVSNVMHVDPKSGLSTRIGMKTLEDGRKVRYAKRSGDLID